MRANELVWRTLVDSAVVDGRRRWESYVDLAFKAGVPETTAHLACRRLVEIGALTKYTRGGFSVVNPEKVLTVACATRSLRRDIRARTLVSALWPGLTSQLGAQIILGGPDAAVHLLGGENLIADIGDRLVYVPADVPIPNDLPKGDGCTLLSMDRRAEREWLSGYTSFAQTYVDLFATPGWQASEFRLALHDRFLRGRDWDRD